jgi:hypothetical protein
MFAAVSGQVKACYHADENYFDESGQCSQTSKKIIRFWGEALPAFSGLEG